MKSAELLAYAKQKYNITEQQLFIKLPEYSVLAHPKTKKWAAVLIKRKDKNGSEHEYCDFKYVRRRARNKMRPTRKPYSMHAPNWVGVELDGADTEYVYGLLDEALLSVGGSCEIILDSGDTGGGFHENAIPVHNSRAKSGDKAEPDKLTELKRMIKTAPPYDAFYSESGYSQYLAENFYKQAKFMEDYEDNADVSADYFFSYSPTYASLNGKQLRAYFSWRTNVREGEYKNIAPSYAYIYIYELLNLIGADSPEDALEKLEAFVEGFFETEEDFASIRKNLARWKFEFCVVNGLPADTALKYASGRKTERDNALIALKDCDNYTDEEVLNALLTFCETDRYYSPVIAEDKASAARLFAAAWRNARRYEKNGKPLFEQCFGEKYMRRWNPLFNAVWFNRLGDEKFSYKLNGNREYIYDDKNWYLLSYETHYFNRDLLRGFMHAADLAFRRYLKTGRYLKNRQSEEWAEPYIKAAVEQFDKERTEAARPKINIEIGGLDKIRKDAARTRESLLTDFERGEDIILSANSAKEDIKAIKAVTGKEAAEKENAAVPDEPEGALNEVQSAILAELLDGGSADDILKREHLMPSIAADQINERLYDIIGDTALDFEGDKLKIIEDYREDLQHVIGGC